MKNMTLFLLTSLLALGALPGEAKAAEPVKTQSVVVLPGGFQPSLKGPENMFTGTARIDRLIQPSGEPFISGGYITLEPGARTFWHTHPTEQYLFITFGKGRIGEWNGSVREVRAGDMVYCPRGVKHWHGAAPDAAMTHLAITGMVDGKNHDWMEEVTDEQYNASILPK
ncbi:cupin domain-containing protein [Bilophila wadsworthia]|uniref:(R)-mandelonitrile lyase n=1 Tax=Bilophila wadsworthia TaxID=35833 RepID=UPI003AABDF27